MQNYLHASVLPKLFLLLHDLNAMNWNIIIHVYIFFSQITHIINCIFTKVLCINYKINKKNYVQNYPHVSVLPKFFFLFTFFQDKLEYSAVAEPIMQWIEKPSFTFCDLCFRLFMLFYFISFMFISKLVTME